MVLRAFEWMCGCGLLGGVYVRVIHLNANSECCRCRKMYISQSFALSLSLPFSFLLFPRIFTYFSSVLVLVRLICTCGGDVGDGDDGDYGVPMQHITTS